MPHYLNDPIYYLEDNDFDSQGNLINPKIPKNILSCVLSNFPDFKQSIY